MTANDVCSKTSSLHIIWSSLATPKFFITNFEQFYHEIFSVRQVYFTFSNSGW